MVKIDGLAPSVAASGLKGASESGRTQEARSTTPALNQPVRGRGTSKEPVRASEQKRLLLEFGQPADEVRQALSHPLLSATLSEVISELAPNGTASDAHAQYTASVLATHLSARQQLSTKLNALIRA